MVRLHLRLRLDALKTPQLRIALKNICQKLHLLLSRLSNRPAAQLMLIGVPGTGKITLSNQIILIEAAEPGSQLNRTLQSALNFISKIIRFTVQNRRSCSKNNVSIGLREIVFSINEPLHEPAVHVNSASADRWNIVTIKK